MGIRFSRRAGAAGIAVAGLLAAGILGAPWARAADPPRYVALGDSSAAGPRLPNQIPGECMRSDQDWPHRLVGKLTGAFAGASLTDVTCTGAMTAHLTQNQFTDVDPQLKAVTDQTKLVTLAIGANDLYLGFAFSDCANLEGPRTCEQVLASPTTKRGAVNFPALLSATAPKVGAALDAIHRQAPQAKVFVVGYLTYWQPDGCHPPDPYTARDANFIQSTLDKVMDMLSNQAASHGARYVDIRNPSREHGLCAPEDQRWLEGNTAATDRYPYHPNPAGMEAAAGLIAQAINAS